VAEKKCSSSKEGKKGGNPRGGGVQSLRKSTTKGEFVRVSAVSLVVLKHYGYRPGQATGYLGRDPGRDPTVSEAFLSLKE